MTTASSPTGQTLSRAQFSELLKTSALKPEVFTGEGIGGCVIGTLENTLTAPGLEVAYSNHFEHPAGKPSQADITADCIDPWDFVELAFAVLDADGKALDQAAIAEIIGEETTIYQLDESLLGQDA